jgi:hypothetical protein
MTCDKAGCSEYYMFRYSQPPGNREIEEVGWSVVKKFELKFELCPDCAGEFKNKEHIFDKATEAMCKDWLKVPKYKPMKGVEEKCLKE